ncbi:hypothetical protein HYDPIDRAFT_99330 [Hydnomerulius pinastri MD-312]|uniref:Protein-S-isoprenylcysteine O-methyltransferase n=1 Tax=Hydnomerulius pinastri MD-312 TaxID=994086 RepID=A0A0C9V429_9AGAM|nr:hypothetical protein HYDPIDRAFT_99330 [Hydnomerulius pinastri MD-312]
MSLLRLPFIIGAAAGFHVSVTAPVEAPAAHERVKASLTEVMLQLSIHLATIMKSILWAGVAAETTATISFHLADDRVPGFVRSLRGLPTQSPSTVFAIASTCALAGGLIRLWCYRTLGRFFTFQLSIREDHSIITTGPYSYVRHPSYTGLLMCCAGILMMHSSPGAWMRDSGMQLELVRWTAWTWALIICAAMFGTLRRLKEEDGIMQQAFGEQWEIWAKKVKYLLVPGLY